MLSFSVSVAVNNLLALKSFYTFLFNYGLHEKPSLLEHWFLPRLSRWVEKRAMATLKELMSNEEAKLASVSLNDVDGSFFAVLYSIQNPQLTTSVTTGQELFLLLAQMSLEFEKVKHPRDGTKYQPTL